MAIADLAHEFCVNNTQAAGTMNTRRSRLPAPRGSASSPPIDIDELCDAFDEGQDVRSARRGRRRKQDVSIRRTAVGKGIFACRRIRRDEIVGEIEGDIVEDVGYGSNYCFKLGERHRLEPEPPFRYVNHCCDPNCEFDWIEVAEDSGSSAKRRAFIIALKDIQRGEQLTIDYNWSASAAIPCRCNSPKCRGWIVDEDQLEELIETSSTADQEDFQVRG